MRRQRWLFWQDISSGYLLTNDKFGEQS